MFPYKSSNLCLDTGKFKLFTTAVMRGCHCLSVKNLQKTEALFTVHKNPLAFRHIMWNSQDCGNQTFLCFYRFQKCSTQTQRTKRISFSPYLLDLGNIHCKLQSAALTTCPSTSPTSTHSLSASLRERHATSCTVAERLYWMQIVKCRTEECDCVDILSCILSFKSEVADAHSLSMLT